MESMSYHLLRKGRLEMESIFCGDDLKQVLDMLTLRSILCMKVEMACRYVNI